MHDVIDSINLSDEYSALGEIAVETELCDSVVCHS